MNYDTILKKIKQADEIMLSLNDHEKDYKTALELFSSLAQTAKYMKLYLTKKQSDGVELKHAEQELNIYMVTE